MLRVRDEYINWQYQDAGYDETAAVVLQLSSQKRFTRKLLKYSRSSSFSQ